MREYFVSGTCDQSCPFDKTTAALLSLHTRGNERVAAVGDVCCLFFTLLLWLLVQTREGRKGVKQARSVFTAMHLHLRQPSIDTKVLHPRNLGRQVK